MQKCKACDAYRGDSPPKCNGGRGCETCAAKYMSRIRAEMHQRMQANVKPEKQDA